MKNVGLIAVSIIVAALIGWFVYERFIVSEETRVRRVLAGAEKALEKHDAIGFGNFIAPDYTDAWGYGAGEVKGIALEGMREFETIEINPTDVAVEVSGASATIVFYPVCKFSNPDGQSFDVDREILKGHLLKLTLKNKDRVWRISRTELEAEK